MIGAAWLELPPWLTDVSVLTALVTAMGGVLGAAITNLATRKDKENKLRDDNLAEQFNDVSGKLDSIMAQAQATGERVVRIEKGTKTTQRYRLYHDLTRELIRGYTDGNTLRELSNLFASYQSLGGNGEIETLFYKYKELPLEYEIKKEESDEVIK